MTREQINHYKQEISRVARRSLYIKQWKSFYNGLDNITVTSADYIMPARWVLTVDREDQVLRPVSRNDFQ